MKQPFLFLPWRLFAFNIFIHEFDSHLDLVPGRFHGFLLEPVEKHDYFADIEATKNPESRMAYLNANLIQSLLTFNVFQKFFGNLLRMRNEEKNTKLT